MTIKRLLVLLVVRSIADTYQLPARSGLYHAVVAVNEPVPWMRMKVWEKVAASVHGALTL